MTPNESGGVLGACGDPPTCRAVSRFGCRIFLVQGFGFRFTMSAFGLGFGFRVSGYIKDLTGQKRANGAKQDTWRVA